MIDVPEVVGCAPQPVVKWAKLRSSVPHSDDGKDNESRDSCCLTKMQAIKGTMNIHATKSNRHCMLARVMCTCARGQGIHASSLQNHSLAHYVYMVAVFAV